MNNNNNNENIERKVCRNCGLEKPINEGVQWGSYFYCDNCFKYNKCNVDNYHSPSISTTFLKSAEDKEEEKLFLGIELETTKGTTAYFDNDDHIEDIFYIRKNYKELKLNFEKDSSIGNGMEIITQPMTYKYIKENQDKFKDILNHLIESGNYSHDKGKCGLHIHVSRNALGNSETEIKQTIEKLMLFVETYRNNVELFSRRKHQQYNQYNAYTIPFHKSYGDTSLIKNEDYYKSGKLLYELNQFDSIGHSSVVNVNTGSSTTQGSTVEFRMFRGTLKYETFIATIEFVYNLINVCKNNMTSKISWNKVINYGGDFIKDYVNSLGIIDNKLYLRDYTKQIEDNIIKTVEKHKNTIDNYKKNLTDIEYAMQMLLNEPIDFLGNTSQARDTLSFRCVFYDVLKGILIEDVENVENETTLYKRLRAINKDYSDICRKGLKSLKDTLGTYTRFNLSDSTKKIVVKTIEIIDNMLKERTTNEQ